MTIKSLAAAVALSVLPAMGFAYECGFGKEETASISCAEGTVYDANTGTCVTTTS